MKKLFFALLLGMGFYTFVLDNQSVDSALTEEGTHNEQLVSDAYQNKLSDVQVSGSGVVSRILRDDNKGRRHQKFLLKLSSEQTLLIAHNIDLAPKIKTIKEGDVIQFFGVYEWNSKGGVVHWTHHDPANRHIGGWLKHNGRKYE